MQISLGEKSIVGQSKIKREIELILQSDRLGHAYLIAGPPGIGKKALALAFAECVNGVDNLTELGSFKKSGKSSWLNHPDIHLFIPMPRTYSVTELNTRIQMLNDDPYSIVDFGNRPDLSDQSEGKNKRAGYMAEYFREKIRPTFFLKPNEGSRTVVILTNIELMNPLVSNSFLKVLEEPPDRVLFILTTDNMNSLMPTVLSRCQILKCSALHEDEVTEALVQRDGMTKSDAQYLAKISGGNYAMARGAELGELKDIRQQVVQFLRYSYVQDAADILDLIQLWINKTNTEGFISILNVLEVFLKDIFVYMKSESEHLIVNTDQLDIIRKFTKSLENADLDAMLLILDEARVFAKQNVQAKFILTAMSIRFSYLMRGAQPPVSSGTPWMHMPALTMI